MTNCDPEIITLMIRDQLVAHRSTPEPKMLNHLFNLFKRTPEKQGDEKRSEADGNIPASSQPTPNVVESQTKPGNPEELKEQGVALAQAGQYEAALTSYQQAIAIQPDFYQAWYRQGATLLKLGRKEEALASFEQVLEINPDSYQAWNNRGTLLCELGRHEESLASFDRAVKLKPSQPQTWNNQGILLRKLGRYEEALDSFEQALAMKSNFEAARKNYESTSLLVKQVAAN